MHFPAKALVCCKTCGRFGLWICAFEHGNGEATPVLMCDSYFGCGSVFEMQEYFENLDL